MSSGDKIEAEGVIIKSLPGLQYNVKLSEEFGQGGMIVIAYICGKMKKNKISLMEGDSVLVELTPYDLTKGRITFRKK